MPDLSDPCYLKCLDYGHFMLRAGFLFGALLAALSVSLVWSLTLLVLRRRKKR